MSDLPDRLENYPRLAVSEGVTPRIPLSPSVAAALARRYRLQELALFGSVLRDDFRPDSDVDVLYQESSDAPLTFRELFQLQQELEALFQRRVDLVPKDGLKWVIRDEVLGDAQVLYAR